MPFRYKFGITEFLQVNKALLFINESPIFIRKTGIFNTRQHRYFIYRHFFDLAKFCTLMTEIKVKGYKTNSLIQNSILYPLSFLTKHSEKSQNNMFELAW